jgi:hypothetical protein
MTVTVQTPHPVVRIIASDVLIPEYAAREWGSIQKVRTGRLIPVATALLVLGEDAKLHASLTIHDHPKSFEIDDDESIDSILARLVHLCEVAERRELSLRSAGSTAPPAHSP